MNKRITFACLIVGGLMGALWLTGLPQHVLADGGGAGLLGRWPFDEGNGTNTANVTGTNLVGTLTGSPLPVWTSGISSNALQFDGAQNEVIVADDPVLSPTNALSVTAWVKTATNLSSDVLAKWSTNAVAGSYILGLTNGQVRLELMLNGTHTQLIGSSSLSDTNWHLISGTYDGAQIQVYLDGAVAGSLAASGTVGVVSDPLRMGLLSGQLDDVRLYAQALTTNDVAAIYNVSTLGDGIPDWWKVAHGIAVTNHFPTCSISSPTNGTTFASPASITIQASASDSDGTIAKVEFFAGATKLGETATSPYQYVWTNVTAGSYTLTAKATDNGGAWTTAAGVNSTVTSNQPPVANAGTNQTAIAGTNGLASVTLNGSGSSDPDGTIASYVWTEGASQIATGMMPSVNLALGTNTITLTVTDNLGATGTATTVVKVNPFFSAWNQQMPITSSGYTRSEVLTNFPLLVVLSTNLTGFSYSQFSSPQGWDLRFSDGSGTNELPYEIEQWNTNGNSYVWVRIPLLASNTVVSAYWGNSGVGQQSYTTNGTVWANGYAGVWHLPNGTTLSGADSTANQGNGTIGSGATASAGRIAGSGAFDGSFNADIGMGTWNPLSNGLGTASAWVKWDSNAVGKNNYFLAKGNDAGPVSWGIDLIPNATGGDVYLLYGSAQWVGPASVTSSTGQWHHITAVMKPNAQEIYVDGVQLATGSKATITPAAGTGFFLGKTDRGSPYHYALSGGMDEARVSTAQRSANWIWAEYMNVASNTTFAACGSISAVSVAPSFTSAPATNGLAGMLYTYAVTMTGAPAPGLSASGLPSWLTLTNSTLSGTPPATGSYGPITLTAFNGVSPDATQTFSITVNDTAAAPAITSAAPTNDVVGTAYTYVVTVTGTPTPGLSASGLPSWLTLTNNTLSGTPTTSGSYGPITLTASNGVSPDATQTFSITVNVPPSITSTAQTNAVVAMPYSYTVATTGTPTPGLSASGLPSWLTLTNNTLSGTPTTSGSYGPITLTASNGVSPDATQTFSITVSSSPFASWNQQMSVTASGYTRSEVLTNFPLLVVLSTNLTGFSYSQFSSPQGWDLRFSDGSGTNELPYEIEQWNTNGNSYVWVRVPLLASNTVVSAYWGNSGVGQQSYTTNGTVWANGYAGVWHLPNGTTLSGADSTANQGNGTIGSGATASAGRIAGSGAFDGSFNADIGMGTWNPLSNGLGTASAWVKWDSNAVGKNNYFIAKGNDYGVVSWGIDLIPNATGGDVYLLYGNAQWVGPASVTSSTGQWHHITAVMKPNAQEIYVDGVQLATGSKATITPTAGTGFFLGKTDRGSPYHYALSGGMDEARVSTAQRSANWIWAEYMNVASNTTFNTYGTASLVNPSPVASFTASPTNAVTQQSVAFDATGSSDPNSNALSYAWTFGDGGTGTGVTTSHTYTNVGTFTTALVVDNGHGGTNSATRLIHVYDPTYSTQGDGIPDWWKVQYGFATNDAGVAAADTDGDGLSNYMEYRLGTDPLHVASQVTPTVAIQSGNNQGSVTNAFLLQPLVISVQTNGQVLSAVPVQFTMTQGGALLATNQSATLTNVVVVSTDTNGLAQVWLKTAAVAETNGVTAGIANCTNMVSASFIATSHAIPWDMMGWWAFDEGSGTNTLDGSGYNGRATLTTNGVTWFNSGVVSNALAFAGSSGAVGSPPTVALNTITNGLTVCAFVTTTSTVDQVVCSYQAQETNSGWRVLANTNGLRFQWVSGDGVFHELVSTNGLPSGQWAQVAATLTPGQATLWVDAQVVAVETNAGTGLLLGGTNGLWIGASDNGATNQFNGVLDELQIYRRALSADELSALLTIDSDGDGMPNYWERNHDLNPDDPSDAALDPDGDGLINRLEYQHHADPHNAYSLNSQMPDGWVVAHPTGSFTDYLQDVVLGLRVYTPLEH